MPEIFYNEVDQMLQFSKANKDLNADPEKKEMDRFVTEHFQNMTEDDKIQYDMTIAGSSLLKHCFVPIKLDKEDTGKPKRLRLCVKFQGGEYQGTCSCYSVDDCKNDDLGGSVN